MEVVRTVGSTSATGILVPVLAVVSLGVGLGCWYHAQRHKAVVHKLYEQRTVAQEHGGEPVKDELVVSDLDHDKAWMFMSSTPAIRSGIEKERPPPLLPRHIEATTTRDSATGSLPPESIVLGGNSAKQRNAMRVIP
jgi:hypothetical protein